VDPDLDPYPDSMTFVDTDPRSGSRDNEMKKKCTVVFSIFFFLHYYNLKVRNSTNYNYFFTFNLYFKWIVSQGLDVCFCWWHSIDLWSVSDYF
jgi:hypothetical protein